MKIVVIDTDSDNAPPAARVFLPKLLKDLAWKGDDIILISKAPPAEESVWQLTARPGRLHERRFEAEALRNIDVADAASRLNELDADVYFVWTAEEKGWAVVPLIDPKTATLAVGHADSEQFYAPIRHYRSFLTRVVGVTPETCVGLVLSCVIDKERVEWISYDEAETAAPENLQKAIETYRTCFEKASADALAAPRERSADFPPMNTSRPPSESWFGKLMAKFIK